MNEAEARTLREAASAAVRRYSRMSRSALRVENAAAQEIAGIQHVFGGPVTKDELVSDTLELRGYGIAKLNEATHVLAHDVFWPDCQWCQAADDPPEYDPEDAEAQRIAEDFAQAAAEAHWTDTGEAR